MAPSVPISLGTTGAEDRELERWAAELGLTRTVAGWLRRRGHLDVARTRTFLDPKLRELTSPDGMLDRATAASRLARAVREREAIIVFGDYDCDGITSAAIMTELLRAVGGRVKPMLASRFDGGYGVSPAAVERIKRLGPKLVVTCDCGSSDHTTLELLVQQGIDIVVIDHHLVPDEPLPAVAFLNPHRPECAFPYKGLASCGLALSIAAALRGELGVTLDVRQWLDLVAIGTIADVAPLDGDNRNLVRAGLAAIRKARRPGLRALLSLAKIATDAPLSGRDIAFRVAPHLNAPGRMGAPDLALELLLAKADADAERIALEITEVSALRRQQQESMYAEAISEIEAHDYTEDGAIVVGRAGWNPGVVGIVAGRLADRFQRPVVVIGFEGETGRGSVRGPRGVRLHEALSRVAHCLVRFGGHQAAAGLELRADRLEELRRLFGESIAAQPVNLETAPSDDVIRFAPQDHPLDVLHDLDRVEPCGEANPRPHLTIEANVVQAREVKGGHLKLELALSKSCVLSGFCVGRGDQAATLSGPIRVVGDLRHTSFPGSGGVEVFVEELSAAC